MIRQRTQNFRYFLYSRHVSDALLITAGIIVPFLVMARYDLYEAGAIISLGAMGVGVTDLPGPPREKMKAMLVCNALIFVVALITGYAGFSFYSESVEIAVFCFFFSMFTLYGSRAASIGTTTLMIMIVMMYKHPVFSDIPLNAALLLSGGLWYMLLSFLFSRVMPYRSMQQILGECILEITKSLRLKAKLYDLHTDQNEGLKALMLQQVQVNDKQDDVRNLLFNSSWAMRRPTVTGKFLTAVFVELMDVYEQIITTSYYETIRVRFVKTGVLPIIEDILSDMADNLRNVGRAIQSNRAPGNWKNLDGDFVRLKKKVDEIALNGNENTFMLKKAIITFRSMDQRIKKMASYFDASPEEITDHTQSFEYSLFLSPKNYTWKLFKENLSFQSSTFRYAMRVALLALAGFVITRLLSSSGHSYWVLFTIVFILKPAFSLSKERNYQRMLGTIIGGVITFPIMLTTHHTTVLFFIMMVCMIIAYSFMRIHYLVFVVFMTCYVLLMFRLLGSGGLDIVGERVIDTLIGAVVTFLAIYFVFPNWEFKQVRLYIGDMVKSNRDYLRVLQDYFDGKNVTMHDYKLARKEAYVSFASLAASFQRMNSEPASKQKNVDEILRFVVANHQLSSLIGTNAAAIFTGKLEMFRHSGPNKRYLDQSMELLDKALVTVSHDVIPAGEMPLAGTINTKPKEFQEMMMVKSQLALIRERCVEILKTSQLIFRGKSIDDPEVEQKPSDH